MSVSDADLADACADTYRGYGQTWGTAVVHAYLSKINGVNVVALEGTQSVMEWAIDILGATPEITPLGLVHQGWWRDVQMIAPAIISYAKRISGDWAVTGHSKGAGDGLILAAEMILAGLRPVRIATFGTPHPGVLNDLLAGIPGSDYRNLDDPVWEVPGYLPHPSGRQVTQLSEASALNDTWGPLRNHHIQLYQAGTRKLFPAEA